MPNALISIIPVCVAYALISDRLSAF